MIDLENGGKMVMRTDSVMRYGLNEQESYTFPSPMTLRLQALHSACQFRRKYWMGVVGLLLIIAGIVSAFVIVASKDSVTENFTVTTSSTPTMPTQSPEPAKNYSKKCITLYSAFKTVLFSLFNYNVLRNVKIYM